MFLLYIDHPVDLFVNVEWNDSFYLFYAMSIYKAVIKALHLQISIGIKRKMIQTIFLVFVSIDDAKVNEKIKYASKN